MAGASGSELGELLVELPARHQGWAAMLLDEIAAALGLQARQPAITAPAS